MKNEKQSTNEGKISMETTDSKSHRAELVEKIINIYEKKWFKVFLVLSPILGFLGIVVTSIALMIAINQNKEFGEISKNFEAQNTELEEIAKSVPTRYLDKFPENFYELLNFLEKLERKKNKEGNTLVIAKDVPAYGVFSSSEDYMKYRKKLQKLNVDVNVTMIVYDSITRNESMREQFQSKSSNFYQEDKTKKFIEFLNSKKAREAFDNDNKSLLYSIHGEIIKGNRKMTSNEDLFSILNLIHELEVKQFRGWGINIHEIGERQELFYWIIDSKSAIFSLLNQKPVDREASFITYDNNFIEILNGNYKATIEGK